MSVYTDADSKIHAAHANIRAAAESLSAPIEGLQEIVFRRCWGSTDYNAAYAERVQKTYERLVQIRMELSLLALGLDPNKE